MAHKTLIGGTSYGMSGGRTLIDGVGHDIAGGRTLIDGAGHDISLASYDPVFANNTWEQIIEACQTGRVPSTWEVGDSKTIEITAYDAAGTYKIDIIGKNHDTYTDGSIAPLTFQFHDTHSVPQAMNNISDSNEYGWPDSVCWFMVGNILNGMPTAVKEAVRQVAKVTSIGSMSSELETSHDKLFLLSEVEVYGTNKYSFAGEGTQYEYYKNNSSNIEKYKGSDGTEKVGWWLRSPTKSTSDGYCYAQYSLMAIGGAATLQKYLAPAFCF